MDLISICNFYSILIEFILFRYSVFLREMNMKDQAKEVIIQSIRKYPWNWSAWLDLIPLCSIDQDVQFQV